MKVMKRIEREALAKHEEEQLPAPYGGFAS